MAPVNAAVNAPAPPAAGSAFLELGQSGLRQSAGHIREEFLRDLAGWRGAQVYREMRDNDPVVGAILFSVEMLLRGVEWRVDPLGDGRADRLAAEFVRECLDGMEATFEDTLADILSFLTYGWALTEIVYARRPDGRIGWRKLALRAQDSLARWQFDTQGQPVAMVQQPPDGGPELAIPLAKALLFRTSAHKGNPEGRSVLRNAYRPWYFKRRIEEIEAIGIERDLAGLPVMRVPARLMRATADADDAATYAYAKALVRNIRRDEQEGVVLPAERDEHGQPLFELTLLSTGGRRQFDTGGVIDRYDRRIASTVLADFVLLGQDAAGSYALSDSKTRMFQRALKAWLDAISAVFNRKALPDLLTLNGMAGCCLVVPGEVAPPDLVQLADYVQRLSQAGAALFPDPALEAHLRRAGRLPPRGAVAPGAEVETD